MIKKIYNELIDSNYFKNLFILTSGVGFSQLIPLLLLPILTRFFSPYDFGLLAIFLAAIQLIATSSTFRLEMAVVLPKKDTDAAILCIRAFVTLLLISFIITIIIFGAWTFIINSDYELIISTLNITDLIRQDNFNDRYFPLIIYLVPLGAIFLGFYNILYSWNNRKELYKNMSYSHISHSLLSTPLSIAFYFSPLNKFSLILGQITGRLMACFLLLRHLLITIKSIPYSLIISRLPILTYQYRKFIYFETPHSILNFFAQKIILGFFTAFFGLFTVGILDLADKIIGKPLGVISNSFKTVFYQRLTTAKDKLAIFKKSVFLMLVISTCLIIPFYILPENFFVIVLGPEWADIGMYIKLLCPLLFARFVFNVVMPSLSYTLQNHYLLIWQLIYLILLLFMFWYIPSSNVEDMLFIYSLLGAFMYSLLGFMSYLVLKNKCQT